MNNEITYFDCTNLLYSSFFLVGFFQNETRFQYKFIVSQETPELFGLLPLAQVRDALNYVSLFKARVNNEEFYFCIDLLDSAECFNRLLLEKVKYYFKVNYNSSVIEQNISLSGYREKILPASFFFPLQVPHAHLFFPRLLGKQGLEASVKGFWHRANLLRHLVSLDAISRLRNNVKKDLDIFFVQRYYGEKVHGAGMEFRYQLIKAIKQCSGIKAVAGFVEGKEGLPGKFAEFRVKGYPLAQYLRNMARGRVSIYVRGAHDCLSFKLGQELALGKPVVGQTVINNKESFYINKVLTQQFAYEDPGDIVQQALELLRDPKRMVELARLNVEVFDNVFSPRVAVSGILSLF